MDKPHEPTSSNDAAESSWLSATKTLADCCEPALIGIRHHSAALARVLPRLLDQLAPSSLLLELPADLGEWLEYLADRETVAPVALAAATELGELYFYPLADFSPELVAIRWAASHGVPVVPFDLPVGIRMSNDSEIDAIDRQRDEDDRHAQGRSMSGDPDLLQELLRRTSSSDSGQLWKRLVESRAIGQSPDSVRRAALLFGWAMRGSDRQIDSRDQRREAAMRDAVRRAPQGSVAIIGAFHAPALVPQVVQAERERDRERLAGLESVPVAVSLVPYSFDQLDDRSGYPAGIRDPAWHQAVLEAGSLSEIDAAAGQMVTEMCRRLRSAGHVASTPDATEMLRVMRDLARLRRLPIAGRGELLEAIETCLVHGDLLGRGRAVARAAEGVLIGRRRGKVTSAVPRCGLKEHLRKILEELQLPGPDDDSAREVKEIDLDPLRKARDRARVVVFHRMEAIGVPYARRIDSIERGMKLNILQRWQVEWTQTTSAVVAAAARHGVTLEQAAATCIGLLGAGEDDGAEMQPEVVLRRLEAAVRCGLHDSVNRSLREVNDSFLVAADIPQLVAAADCIAKVASGLVEGLPTDASLDYPPLVRRYVLPADFPALSPLLASCLDRLEGLSGSDNAGDVTGLVELVYWCTGDILAERIRQGDAELEAALGSAVERLAAWCRATVDGGSDRMKGAAAGILGVLGESSPAEFARLTEGWFDGAVGSEGRRRLRFGLAGAAQTLLDLMQSDRGWLDGLESRFAAASDEEFLSRLAALRGGFSELAPADREELLQMRLAEYDERGSQLGSSTAVGDAVEEVVDRGALYAARRRADLVGSKAVERRFPGVLDSSRPVADGGERDTADARSGLAGNEPEDRPAATLSPGVISMADRWRLTLGVSQLDSPAACRAAAALDQLYGRGRGEGARGRLGRRPGGSSSGGTEAPTPRTIDWADDLTELFGSDVCQEVLGEALEGGRMAAAELLDPDTVTPSIELLRQVLALVGGMPQERAAKLRRLAQSITAKLAEQLAIRVRPAFSGLSTPRPTRRDTGRLSLASTVRRNLAHAYRRADGRISVIAEDLIFQSRVRREMDWHLTFVVDVSGSMSTSVVYSALMAAIFSELPAISVRFIAFSTEVIDLSEQVDDPLALLLQVQVGGGTHIGLGLRAARAGIKVPNRSLVVLVTDFEEGVSVREMLAEVRELVDAGVKCLGLAALDDDGAARYHEGCARMVAAAGMSVAAVSPEELVRWVARQIR